MQMIIKNQSSREYGKSHIPIFLPLLPNRLHFLTRVLTKGAGAFLSLVIILTGCVATTSKLTRLNIGMEKSEVVQSMGNPDTIKGSVMGHEVWQYNLGTPRPGWNIAGCIFAGVITMGLGFLIFLTPYNEKDYWLYFDQGTLSKWDQAIDRQYQTIDLNLR